MKYIRLTRGFYAKIDDKDFDWLNQYKWHTVMYKSDLRYARGYVNKEQILMHRLILGLTNPKIHTDHIDGDGLNNQRLNLRPCTFTQNMRNRKSHKGSTSKYVGVFLDTRQYKDKKYTYWVASLTHNNKVIPLGRFKDERRAAIEYDKAKIIYHGEFSQLNILKPKSNH